jgi:hypothetical protein
MPAATPPIFISYRRSDLSLEADWLYALATTFLGEGIAFFDRRSIEGGTRWDETLENGLRGARIVLVLIGPAWLTGQLPSGMRRLDDLGDWVRREVLTTLENHTLHPDRVRVYPVLVNGAKLPPRDWLPEAIAELASFQIEPALQFDLHDYLNHAASIHEFLTEQMLDLQRGGEVPGLVIRPFRREQVPNPYDIPGYQLPDDLRLLRPEHPFKGLAYFLREDAAIFFGRHREIAEIIDKFKKGQNFIRLHGQSGAGKSSLLFAGLFPRLEGKGWRLIYQRRDIRAPMAASLDAAVQELAAQDDGDALVILDQIEEILTAPNPDSPQELDDLVAATARLARLNQGRSRPIRLMWAYRKEYETNIRAALRAANVASTDYGLTALDAAGMRHAIEGITRDLDLKSEYRIELEPDLAEVIIGDLQQRSQAGSATPLLQVLLRKMWDRVIGQPSGPRLFTRELYDSCKSTDLLQLLQERLDTLAALAGNEDLRQAVHSGLALDLLDRLVSEVDTSLSLPQAELAGAYADTRLVDKLLQALVDHYLLVREDGPRCRLAHDTLARAVGVLHARSVLPAQRASRLLDSKAHDIERFPEEVDFSSADLHVIDEGIPGMRRLSAKEQQAVDASRQRRHQEQQDLIEKNRQLEQALNRAERDLLRAHRAELRGIAFRLDGLIAAAHKAGGPADELAALEMERAGLAERLADATGAHLAGLAREIGFRGDFEFLMRWEGVAGKVSLSGGSVFIDPATDLASADPAVIRSRYEFVLTPAELQAVLAVTGKRDDEAVAAYAANPVLGRIHLDASDVDPLVPEVAAPRWRDLQRRYPAIDLPQTPAAVHTALFSLSWHVGLGHRAWRVIGPLLASGDWLSLADAIEGAGTVSPQLPAQMKAVIGKRREAEAALIRESLTQAVAG